MRPLRKRAAVLALAGLPLALSLPAAHAAPTPTPVPPSAPTADSGAGGMVLRSWPGAPGPAKSDKPVAPRTTGLAPAWLDRVNQFRAWNGVKPVTEDASLRPDMVHYLAYVARTGDFGVSDPANAPENAGFVSRNSLWHWNTDESTTVWESLDAWASLPTLLLSMVQSRSDAFELVNDEHYDVLQVNQYDAVPPEPVPSPVVWPHGTDVDILSVQGSMHPDPFAICGDAPTEGWGLPVVVQYPFTDDGSPWPLIEKTAASAHLYEDGTEVPTCVVTPADNQGLPTWAAYAVPRRPLKAGATYTGTFTSNLGSVPISFTTAATITPRPAPTPVPTSSTTRGDLDGDGRRDELVLTKAGTLQRIPGQANGTLGTPDDVSGDFSQVNWIGSPGDLNRDGYQDAVMRLKNGDLMLYAGDGKGGFSGATKIGNGWGEMDASKFFPVTKFTAGATSLLAVNSTNCNLYRYDLAATGTIAATTQVGHGWCGMKQVFSNGDNNGDSIGDIVGITKAGDYLVYAGGGQGNFPGDPVRKGHGWNFVQVSAPGDSDGNTFDDVLARTADGRVYQYLTGKDNSWVDNPVVMTGWGDTYALMQ